MPEMQDRLDETAEWFRYADRDLMAAELPLAGESPHVYNGLFNCQQAVEKWLKALLIWHGVAFPKIHDLKKIGRLCIQAEPELAGVIESVSDLTDFATVYRYPGAEATVDASDAVDWLELTRGANGSACQDAACAARGAALTENCRTPKFEHSGFGDS